MYAKYSFLAGATLANILNDVTNIIGGITDKALLSAACDQANTEILTTYEASGWTVHDAAASASSRVLSAPHADFGVKYCKISSGLGLSSIPSLALSVAESWNAVTHVGTNVVDLAIGASGLHVGSSVAGVVFISANLRKIVLSTFVPTIGYGGGGNGTGWNAVFERVRGIHPADTVGAALPLSMVATAFEGVINVSHNNSTKFCKHINGVTGLAVAGLSCDLETPHKGVSSIFSASSVPAGKIIKDGALSYPIFPISFTSWSYYALSGNISELNDVWLLAPGYGAVEDTLVHNGKTYVLLCNQKTTTPSSANGFLMVPKG